MARSSIAALVAHATTHIYDGNYPNGDRPVGGQSSSLGNTTSITIRGNTWNFSAEVEHGRFVGGDYWVKDIGNGIHVSSRTPAQAVDANNRVIHGSMKNPVPGQDQGMHQSSFLGGGVPANYDNGTWDPLLTVSFPLTLTAGDCLLSCISRLNGEDNNWAGETSGKDPIMRTIEVLTVVDYVPDDTELRPAVTDRTHTRYDTSNINLNILPSLSTAAVTLPSETLYDGYDPADNAFKYFERGTERLWPVWVNGWEARYSHPTDHMKDYHKDISQFLSQAYLMLCIDAPNADKELLAQQLCQIGVDYYHTGIAGTGGDSSWWHGPITIAGHLLGNTTLRDCYENNSMPTKGRDFYDFYYWEDRQDSDNTYVSAYVPVGQTWAGHKVFFRNEYSDTREYEHLRPDEWYTLLPLVNNKHEAWKDDNYRRQTDTFPQVGMTLAENLMGLRSKHAYDATFEMMVRWMVDADNTAEHATLNTYFLDNGADFDPNETIATNSAGGFIDDMWAAHAASVTWPSQGGTVERTL